MSETRGYPVRRVLMTADPVGGVWTYAMELARVLASAGTETVVAAMGGPVTPAQRRQASRIAALSVYESGYKLEWMRDPWKDVEAAGAWLLDLEARVRPDIVHLNGYVHGALPWRTPTLVVGHSCVLSWHEAVYGQEAPSPWERYRRDVSRGLASAGLVTAPSNTMLSTLRRLYGGFRDAGPVYNGRSTTAFPPGEKEPFIMTAGRIWDEAKNIRMLDQVAGSLAWPVYAAGEQSHPDGGGTRLGGVELLGNLSPEELAAWLGRASIFVLPARYEPFGLCALEAALAGCVLVLGDIPSLREIWGETVLYVPPDRPDRLESALRLLIGDNSFRTLLRNRSRARALEFTPERMGKRYMSLYSLLLRNGTTESSREEGM